MTIATYEQPRGEVAIANYQDVATQRLGEWARSAEAAHHIATTLVQTSFCPDQFRGKAGEATAAILAGLEVGLQPMAALRAFDIIQGSAAPRAITLRAVVQAQGHEMVLVESNASRCKMKGRRRGTSEWSEVVWTIDRAKQAKLAGKPNWLNQPTAMLLARATSELARIIASDAILGIGYSAEEIADGATDQAAEETTTPTGTRKMSRALRPVDAPPEPVEDEHTEQDEPAPAAEEIEPDGITGPQLKNIGRLCTELGLTERAAALAYAKDVIGRDISSRSDLTKAEASAVIDAMAVEAEQAATS